jgi:hypothetical protein
MKKFEYYLLRPERSIFKDIDYEALNERLNQLGSLGWEVVTTAPVTAAGSTIGLLITLKRELPE